MAVQIAKLSTVATLDSTQFGSGIARMTTSIGAFSGIALGAFNRIGAGVVNMTQRVLTALPRMVTASIRAGDDLGDLATELGFTTEALSTLTRVAGLAGIEIGGVQSMVGKLNQTLGEAQSGSKAANQAFEELGLSVRSLASQSPEEVFFQVLEALNQIPGAAKRSAAAVSLLGRGGRPALRLMGTDWASERMTTSRLGLAGRSGDVAALGLASDTLDDLENNLKGFGYQLAIRLSPAVTAVGQDFLDFSKKTSLAANAADFFANGLKTAAFTVAASLDTIRNATPFGLLGGGKSFTEQLYDSLNKANQPASGESPSSPTGSSSGVGRAPKRPWNTSGYRVKPVDRIASQTDAIVAGAAAQMQAVPPLPARGNSWAVGDREEKIKWRIWEQMLAEMKKVSENTKPKQTTSNGGARP